MKINTKGFTLVELMIVIVILGILMAAILPRLTGGQARTRDLARKSDMAAISQVMENFYGDHGRYPGINNASVCLSGSTISNSIDNDDLSSYLKGGEMITPPSDKQAIGTCTGTSAGTYWYKPITANGIGRGGYIILTPVDQGPTANALFANISDDDTLKKAETTLNTFVPADLDAVDAEGVYVITSQ